MERLFAPIKINKVEIKNRIAMAPTGMLACAYDGSITEQNIAHYVARAKGGIGLIIIERTFATYKYAAGIPRIIGIYHDRQMSGMRELADAIHTFGAKSVVQLSLGLGRAAIASQWEEREIVAPSALPYRVPEGSAPRGLTQFERAIGPIPRELTVEEIVELEEIFVAAAERIKRAGFEGIEIHGAHGYLIAQFVSPLSNQRHDLYGGTFERRLTLPLNLIRKTREKLGSDFIIGYRISGDEHAEGGLTLEDTVAIVSILEKAGLDYIHLSSGRIEALKWLFPEKEGMLLPEAEAIKKAVKIPVICPNIHTPQLAAQALQDGKTDMVSLSRAVLADPEWPTKAKEGRFDEIQRCCFCNTCLRLIFEDQCKVRCSVNPYVGLEKYIPNYYPLPPR
jgi:2,4-dienoyl-CoA reductase-like NADH-dependent reductase (Old Yellow Enzyme family)